MGSGGAAPEREMSEVDDVLATVRSIDGWMTDGQGRRLYTAAAACPASGRIVEIGSFRGRSTIVLASAVGDGVEVVAVDPHAGNDRGPQEIDGFGVEAATDRQVFEANLAAAGVADRVRHVARFSDAAHGDVGDPIDVLYIDGAHRYRPARADVRDWGARVAPGGVLLIHDSFSSVGVTLAIARELLFGAQFRYVGRSRSLAEYRREPIDGAARLANVARQLAQLPWFARNLAIKVALTLGAGKLLRRLQWPY